MYFQNQFAIKLVTVPHVVHVSQTARIAHIVSNNQPISCAFNRIELNFAATNTNIQYVL